MDERFVWHSVELTEDDACEFCGGHPEVCGCDDDED
jgi:hypothetical protein